MAQVNLVKKKAVLSRRDIIKYQLLHYCFMTDLSFSPNEIDCLTLLGMSDEIELTAFCNMTVDENIFKVTQTVRNFISKAEKDKLIIKVPLKERTNKKKIFLNPDLKIFNGADGLNILLDLKLIYVT